MSDSESTLFQLFNEIGIIDQLSSHAFTQVLPRGFSIAQFTVLNHFVRLGHQQRTPAQLASAFQVSRPTMSTTLSRMERSGYITLSPDPDDRRAKQVELTQAGKDMRDRCLTLLAEPLRDAGDKVPDELVAELLPLLQRLRAILDKMRD